MIEALPAWHAVSPHAGPVVLLRTFPRVLAGDPLCTVVEM